MCFSCDNASKRTGTNKLQQLYTRTDIYHYSFLPRTIPDWNYLRTDNINELDLIQFMDLVMNL